VLIYIDNKSFNIIQDALALREVYYSKSNNLVICGSQPNILVNFSNPLIKESKDPLLNDFKCFQSPQVREGRLWVGDSTAFEGVKHLLPNHFLDLLTLESHRYWPNTPLPRIELDDAVAKCSSFLQGALKAVAHRHQLMMAITAGFDSRVLLAASRDLRGSIYYFINKIDELNEQHPDIKIPKEIFKRIGIDFHVHEYSKDVPDDFREIYFKNTYFSRETLLPVIHNIYYKNHSEKMNILGVGEIGRTKFYDEPNKVTPYYLSYMLHHRKSPFAVNECEKWLLASKDIAHQYGLNIMTLFWWEILIGNWGSVGNSESDIAIEEFDPYASHFIYETFLQVDSKYRTFKKNRLFTELVRYMWSELLDVPVNPSETIKAKFQDVLYSIGLEYELRYLKARFHEVYYHLFLEKK